MRTSLRRAFFEGFVVKGDWTSPCARQFWGSRHASVVAVVVAVVVASIVESSSTGVVGVDGKEGALSSGELGDDAAESSEGSSTSSQMSESDIFVVPVRGFLESNSMGLLRVAPLSSKWKIKMRREPRWSRDDVQ